MAQQKQKELDTKIGNLNNLMNSLIDLFNKKDVENLTWKQELKNKFIEALKACKPIFIEALEDAEDVKASIEHKNRILEDLLYDDYNEYCKKKEELSDINGSYLDNNLDILENYISIINNCYELLETVGGILPTEILMYTKKITKLTYIVGDIEEINYMR